MDQKKRGEIAMRGVKAFFIALLVLLNTNSYALELTVDSRITEVVIYPDSALVNRHIRGTFPKGTGSCVLSYYKFNSYNSSFKPVCPFSERPLQMSPTDPYRFKHPDSQYVFCNKDGKTYGDIKKTLIQS